jgi:RNA polymerase sigma-70 factor (ECF subfamily)
MLNWFVGPFNYGLFMEWVFDKAGTDWQLKAVAGNGQPGFAAYRRVAGGYELHTLQIFTVTAEGISRNSVFQDAEVFASFGLEAQLTEKSNTGNGAAGQSAPRARGGYST